MKLITPVIHVCFALLLAACGGGGDLSIDVPGGGVRTLKLVFHPGHAVEHRLPFHISGGVSPYVSSIDGCPDWVTLFPDQGILAGTGPAGDHGKTFFCTYVVTDSATIGTPQSVSFGLRLAVNPPAPLVLPSATDQAFIIGTYRSVTLPAASGGIQPYTYSFTCAGGMLPSGMGFAPATRVFAGTPDALFPRFVHVYGNGQLAARRDVLECPRSRGDQRGSRAADASRGCLARIYGQSCLPHRAASRSGDIHRGIRGCAALHI